MRLLIPGACWILWCGILGATPAATHTVVRGETLTSIAREHGITVKDLRQCNPDLQGEKIAVGKVLQLPTATPPTPTAPTTKTGWVRIKKGDTLAKISREQGISIEDLRRWNRLREDHLQLGSLLRLTPPKTSATSTPTVTKKAESAARSTPAPPKTPAFPFVGPARSQIDAPKDRLREWEYIVVHHSGTPGGNAKVFDYYHRHDRGMENGLAYHFVIGNGSDSGDGQIEVGPRWLAQKQGGHLASESLNEISIGICLVGDFSTHRLGPRQTAALIELVQYLRKIMPGAKLKFRLHREINTKPTECPGKLFPSQAIHEILDAPSVP